MSLLNLRIVKAAVGWCRLHFTLVMGRNQTCTWALNCSKLEACFLREEKLLK